MPESRGRRQTRSASRPIPPPTRRKPPPSPPWYGAAMSACFVIGIAWLVVYYVTNGGIVGQRVLDAWNLVVGFAFICVGFALATRWR